MPREKKPVDPNAPKVYLILEETSMGPILGSHQEAMDYLLEQYKEAYEGPKTEAELIKRMERDYPAIEEVTLGDTGWHRDR